MKIGISDLEDWECSSMSAIIDDDQIEILIKNNPSHMTRDHYRDTLCMSNCKAFENNNASISLDGSWFNGKKS